MAGSALELLPGCALPQLREPDAPAVLTRLAQAAVAGGYARDSLVAAVVERERLYPTGLPTPIPAAIPHTDPEHVLRPGLGVATLAEPIAFGQMGSAGLTLDVRFVVMLFVTDPPSQVAALQQVLERLGDTEGMERLLATEGPDGFEAAVQDWLHGRIG